MYLKYSKIKNVKSPNRANIGADAGIDLFIPNDFEKIILNPRR